MRNAESGFDRLTLSHSSQKMADGERAAPFFIDLLQLVRCLLLKNPEDMDEEGALFFGFGPESEGTRLFAGAQQANAFLTDFDLAYPALLQELGINALFRMLELSVLPLHILPGTLLASGFSKEGTEVSASTPYGRLGATRLLLRVLNMPLMRICEFQTYVATEVRFKRNQRGRPIVISDDPDYVIREHPFVPPKGMDDESYRMMRMGGGQVYSEIFKHDVSRMRHDTALTPTLCAWWSRARHLAGMDRHDTEDDLTEMRSKDSERYSAYLGGPHWAVNSKVLVDRVSRGSDATGVPSNRLCRLLFEDVYYNHLAGHLFDEEGDASRRMSDRDQAANYFAAVEASSTEVTLDLDLCYSKFFPGFISQPIGLYGRDGERHIKFTGRLDPFAACRVGKWSIPKYRVESIDELREVLTGVVAGTRDALRSGGSRKLVFRGQTHHYSIERQPCVNDFLYGNPDVDELSLTASAVRRSFDIESFFPRFQLQVQGILYSELNRSNFNTARLDSDEIPGMNKGIAVLPFADEEIWSRYRIWRRMFGEAEWDLFVMGLAQHYSVPTLGVDVTDHLGVARWFAWNQLNEEQTPEGTPQYRPLSADAVRDSKPVIYVLVIDTSMRHYLTPLEQELSLDAARVFRQKAFLHYGGSFVRQNRCAEDVVAVIELGDWSRPKPADTAKRMPLWYEYSMLRELSVTTIRLNESIDEMVNNVYLRDWAHFDQEVSCETLFPGAAEDPVFGQLMALKRRALDEGISNGYEYLR